MSSGSTSVSLNNTPQGGADDYFYRDISRIMRGYGDCAEPLRESVILVSKILRQQLRGILNEVIETAIRRQNNSPSQQDFEFLMRKNPTKIARLQKYLRDAAYIKKKARVIFPNSEEIYAYDNADGQEIEREIMEKYDEEKNRRLFRADRISQILTAEEHLKFNEARRTIFLARHFPVMKSQIISWLKVPSDPDIILTHKCLTILSYLAHETIATIVDFAILTRLNSSNRISSPNSWSSCSGENLSSIILLISLTKFKFCRYIF